LSLGGNDLLPKVAVMINQQKSHRCGGSVIGIGRHQLSHTSRCVASSMDN
jgi:hypothetical protein